ncbi:MAG: sulfotransferase [Anaerolineae bacterium]|nr:sulfotransferase [Anaerolineae bacterium]
MFNFKRLWRITILNFFKTRGTIARLTPRRWLILLGFYLLYAVVESTTWLCFALDRIFYPDFLKVKVKSPVFIIGNPRSGTTFSHRLMAADETNFCSMRMWEIFFAPSIVQRKIWLALVKMDIRLGGYGHRYIEKWDQRLYNANPLHRTRLSTPEEDEYLMIHQGTTIIAGMFFGFPDEAQPFVKFDELLPEREKQRAGRYYKRCIQRHMYFHGQERIFISKNPFFTPKIDMLLNLFPDAMIIYLGRNPLKVVPSFASLSALWWHGFCDTPIEYPHTDFIMNTAKYWYRYPLAYLESHPEVRYMLVEFDDMVGNPKRTITQIYERLGLEIKPVFSHILDKETIRSRQYRSKHEYSLDEVGFTREQILAEFNDVFDAWGFRRDLSENQDP